MQQTRLSPADRLALQSAIGDASLARGFSWVRDVVLAPHGVVRLSELSDVALVASAASAIGA